MSSAKKPKIFDGMTEEEEKRFKKLLEPPTKEEIEQYEKEEKEEEERKEQNIKRREKEVEEWLKKKGFTDLNIRSISYQSVDNILSFILGDGIFKFNFKVSRHGRGYCLDHVIGQYLRISVDDEKDLDDDYFAYEYSFDVWHRSDYPFDAMAFCEYMLHRMRKNLKMLELNIDVATLTLNDTHS